MTQVAVWFDPRPEFNSIRTLIPVTAYAEEIGISVDELLNRERVRFITPVVGYDYWIIDGTEVPDATLAPNAVALKAIAIARGWGK